MDQAKFTRGILCHGFDAQDIDHHEALGVEVDHNSINLSWNPSWRSSAQEALKHSYFRQNSQVFA